MSWNMLRVQLAAFCSPVSAVCQLLYCRGDEQSCNVPWVLLLL